MMCRLPWYFYMVPLYACQYHISLSHTLVFIIIIIFFLFFITLLISMYDFLILIVAVHYVFGYVVRCT